MATKIFVNLPVKDLDRSMAFFKKLDFGFNAQFTNASGACMIVSEDIYVMLLIEPFFKGFTPKPIADATRTTEVIVCLSSDSRADVDKMVKAALAAGGSTHTGAKDHGFMYQHGFTDLDGHIWELAFMEAAAIQK